MKKNTTDVLKIKKDDEKKPKVTVKIFKRPEAK